MKRVDCISVDFCVKRYGIEKYYLNLILWN